MTMIGEYVLLDVLLETEGTDDDDWGICIADWGICIARQKVPMTMIGEYVLLEAEGTDDDDWGICIATDRRYR